MRDTTFGAQFPGRPKGEARFSLWSSCPGGPQRMQSNFNVGFGGVGQSGFGHSIWGKARVPWAMGTRGTLFGEPYRISVATNCKRDGISLPCHNLLEATKVGCQSPHGQKMCALPGRPASTTSRITKLFSRQGGCVEEGCEALKDKPRNLRPGIYVQLLFNPTRAGEELRQQHLGSAQRRAAGGSDKCCFIWRGRNSSKRGGAKGKSAGGKGLMYGGPTISGPAFPFQESFKWLNS